MIKARAGSMQARATHDVEGPITLALIRYERAKGAKTMRTIRGIRFMTVAGFLAVLGLASGTHAQEEQIPLRRVPKAVMDSAKAKFPGAKIMAASEETEEGKPPVFALEMRHQYHTVDVTFEVDGTVVLVETDVYAKDLPKVVLRAVDRKYPGAGIRGVVSVKQGSELKKKADHYELYLVKADNKPALLKVAPDGRVLYPEEKTAAKNRDKKGMKKG
jgi:hypothetical protein